MFGKKLKSRELSVDELTDLATHHKYNKGNHHTATGVKMIVTGQRLASISILLLGKKRVFPLRKLDVAKTEHRWNLYKRVIDFTIKRDRDAIFNRSGMAADRAAQIRTRSQHRIFVRSDPRLPSASFRPLYRLYDAQDQVSDGFPQADLGFQGFEILIVCPSARHRHVHKRFDGERPHRWHSCKSDDVWQISARQYVDDQDLRNKDGYRIQRRL